MRYFRNSQRGDTIVEVLICMAVLGSVLGGAYVAASRNSLTNRSSQERLEAVKIAEGQIERLRIIVGDDISIFDRDTPFCLVQPVGNELSAVSYSNPACFVTGGGETANAGATPRYHASIEKDTDVSSAGVTGARFKVSVTWSNVRGTGDDTLETRYEVYR